MSEWQLREIGEVSSIYNGSTPSTNVNEYWNGKITWITPKDLSDQNKKYIEKGERFITDKGLSKVKTKLLPSGTILLSSRAPIGLLSIARKELVTNQGFKNIVVNPKIINNEFLFYLLKLKVKQLNNLGTGTTFKELSKQALKKFKIRFPNLPTQQRIASVLSALDDKIELNNKINDNLEQMAKTLYDYWFVQFDFPDKNGKPYKSSGGEMIYSKILKREIPKEWEVKKLGKVLKTCIGGTPSTTNKQYWNGKIPWMNSGEVANFPLLNTEQKITQEAVDNSSTKFLKKGSVLLSITRHLRVNILGIDACINQSIAGIEESEDFKSSYIYFSILNDIDRLMSLRTGAQQPHINKQIVDSSPFVKPDKETLHSYYKIAMPVIDKIINNAKQIQELASLRDWLLPMLMNGQVKVE